MHPGLICFAIWASLGLIINTFLILYYGKEMDSEDKSGFI